jgi:D-alanyl-D-alanine carboxypeptidase (penicillin-binding protein 5/6)
MHYRQVYGQKKKQSRHLSMYMLIVLLLVGLLGGYCYYALNRALPLLLPAVGSLNLQTGTGVSKISWPAAGQSAVAVDGTTILESHGSQTPVAIASVAKVITALTVLQKKPLTSGQSGPTITLTEADAALYNSYLAREGSVLAVSIGEQITEHQMLEAVMLPSANNIADSLAIWAFGSMDDYHAAATKYVASLGLGDTHIGSDASGFSPTSTSTAHDLVLLGKAAMDNPVLRQIVGQSTASDIPQVSPVTNVNFLLGTNNIIGIKTGNTDQAGGVYLSASTTKLDDQTVTIITALVGAPTLFQALQTSLPMIASAQANFAHAKLLAQGAVVGEYRLPWGGILPAATETNLGAQAWNGSTVTTHVRLHPITTTSRLGEVVGNATGSKTPFSSGDQTNVILLKTPTAPSTWWRLLHPLT